jgi:beta-glucosidase
MKLKLSAIGLLCALLAALVPVSHATEQDVQSRVDALLEQMTLEEKIGQLNQYSNTFDVTGPPPGDQEGSARLKKIKKGLVGSMLNLAGVEETR